MALLQKRVDAASPNSLAAIRAEVAASVAATQSFVQQMQGTGSAVTAEKAALQQASEAARGSVTDFMHAYYDEHKFDAYLEFASTQDRDEYRKREEERKRAIDKALAEHTPEGNLQANKLAIEQLKDAGAHGADRSPDYEPRLHSLENKGENLSSRLSAAQGAKTRQERENAAVTTSAKDGPPPDASAADAIARFRAQVALADPKGDGHGLTVAKAQGATPSAPSH